MAPTERKLREFIKLAAGPSIGYNLEAKARFHAMAKEVLCALADHLDLTTGSYNIRSNQGGIAVSGAITLHAQHHYIQFAQYGIPDCFLYRACKSQTDYAGLRNHWMQWANLNNIPAAAAEMGRNMEADKRTYLESSKLCQKQEHDITQERDHEITR